MSGRRLWLLLPLVGAVAALVTMAVVGGEGPAPSAPRAVDGGRAPAVRRAAGGFSFSSSRPVTPATVTGSDGGASCVAGAALECDGGDVWSFDSCGRREARVAVCNDRICERGRCVEPAPGPTCAGARVSESGRCEGALLRYCEQGVARTVDCAARRQRCGKDEFGEANCLPVDERPPAPASPCGACPRGFTCATDGTPNAQLRCERRMTAAEARAHRCFGCECPRAETRSAEICDGLDNDWDDVIDNNVSCPPVEAAAFLVADGDGRTAESEERVREDFAQNRALFPTGLVLRDVRVIVRPPWLDASDETLRTAMRDDAELHRRDEPPFVPVVYARTVTIGAKSAAGVGTLPNGQCARMAPLPAFVDDGGVVVLARRRRPTTLAHEIGHFLGLCHTHQRDRAIAAAVVLTEAGSVTCSECARTGDGICDTPVDPGLDDGCVAGASPDDACAVSCASGDRPSPNNLMSYYPCRESFTEKQELAMRLWWSLRRARPGAPPATR